MRSRQISISDLSGIDSFDQWMQRWLKEVCPLQYKPNTCVKFAQVYEMLIRGIFSGIPVERLDEKTVRRKFLLIRRQHPEYSRTSSTVRLVYDCLHAALCDAYRCQLTSRDLSPGLCGCKRISQKNGTLKEEEIGRLLVLPDRRYLVVVVAILLTGMKIGELRALLLSDMDREKGTFSVYKTIVDIKDEKGNRSWELQMMPRNCLRNRTVYYPKLLDDWLEPWMRKRETLKKSAGESWKTVDFLFCEANGQPIRVNRFYRRMKEIMTEIGRPDVSTEGLRKTVMMADRYEMETYEAVYAAQYGETWEEHKKRSWI